MMATKRRIERRGDRHYLYEVTPFWDSDKKQGRNKKVYLGPCDADGNLPSIPKIGRDGLMKILNMAYDFE